MIELINAHIEELEKIQKQNQKVIKGLEEQLKALKQQDGELTTKLGALKARSSVEMEPLQQRVEKTMKAIDKKEIDVLSKAFISGDRRWVSNIPKNINLALEFIENIHLFEKHCSLIDRSERGYRVTETLLLASHSWETLKPQVTEWLKKHGGE